MFLHLINWQFCIIQYCNITKKNACRMYLLNSLNSNAIKITDALRNVSKNCIFYPSFHCLGNEEYQRLYYTI